MNRISIPKNISPFITVNGKKYDKSGTAYDVPKSGIAYIGTDAYKYEGLIEHKRSELNFTLALIFESAMLLNKEIYHTEPMNLEANIFDIFINNHNVYNVDSIPESTCELSICRVKYLARNVAIEFADVSKPVKVSFTHIIMPYSTAIIKNETYDLFNQEDNIPYKHKYDTMLSRCNLFIYNERVRTSTGDYFVYANKFDQLNCDWNILLPDIKNFKPFTLTHGSKIINFKSLEAYNRYKYYPQFIQQSEYVGIDGIFMQDALLDEYDGIKVVQYLNGTIYVGEKDVPEAIKLPLAQDIFEHIAVAFAVIRVKSGRDFDKLAAYYRQFIGEDARLEIIIEY